MKRSKVEDKLSISILHKMHLGKVEIFRARKKNKPAQTESISDRNAISSHYTSKLLKHQYREPADAVRCW